MYPEISAFKPKQALRVAGTAALTASYAQVTSATTQTASCLKVFNNSGAAIKLALGAAASEVDIPFYIPSGSEPQYIFKEVPKGTRITVRALDTNGSTGNILVNLLG